MTEAEIRAELAKLEAATRRLQAEPPADPLEYCRELHELIDRTLRIMRRWPGGHA